MTHASFTDIRIVGKDESASKPDQQHKDVWYVHFRLSERAPYQWPEIFQDEWQSPLSTKPVEVRVSGDRLVIRCALDDLKDCHFPRLKKAVEETNREYREFLAKQTRATEAEKEKQKLEREQLHSLNDELDFD